MNYFKDLRQCILSKNPMVTGFCYKRGIRIFGSQKHVNNTICFTMTTLLCFPKQNASF